MKHELTLFYSVVSGGDGSAYPHFMSSMELAEWDQEHLSEGWGESCTGSITVESDSPITIRESIQTPESFLIDLIDGDNDDLEEFLEKFFPNGKPEFRVETEEVKSKGYLYNKVFVGDKQVAKIFRREDESGDKFEQLLNA